ncbi:MAG TPA: ComEC/Rec2 family competence protein [Chitinivibrionales bacterium]|nr:ComEC/Rec2 family competence protein [Chitinivibrionales bacterium]
MMHKKIFAWFPLLDEWARFPGFTGWIGLSAGIACGALLQPFLSFSSIFYNEVLIVAIILSLVPAIICASARFRMLWFFAAGAALVCQCYCQQRIEYSGLGSRICADRHARLSGVIISAPEQSSGRFMFLVKCDSVFSLGKPGALKGRHVTCYCNQKPPFSGGFSGIGRFTPPRPAANPGGFDEYLFSLSNNIWGKFYCDSIILTTESRSPWHDIAAFARTTVFKAASAMKNSDARAVLVASFINDRSDLTDSVKGLFFRAGIFHLLALSGFNLTILAGAIYALLLFFPLGREVKCAIVLVCIWAYLFFIGPIPSLARAVIMTSVVLISFFFQRKPYLLNSLGIAGTVWLIFSPLSLFTPGYQLSFGATFGLAALYPALSGAFTFHGQRVSLIKKASAPLMTALLVSFSAFLTTAPILAYHFGTLSLSGIIVNLFAIFLMSLSMWIALAGFFLQVVFPPFVPFCMRAAESSILLMLKCAGVVSMMPMSMFQLPRFFPAVYGFSALFIVGLCTAKRGLVKRYLLFAGTGFVLAIAVLLVIQRNAAASQAVSFLIKKSNITGIRWPNGKVWLAGLGEKAPQSVFSQVIAPWMRLSPGASVQTVILAGDPCNAVQSLEPVLTSGNGIQVLSCDSVAGPCPDFIAFLNEYHANFAVIKSKRYFFPSPRCTLEVSPSVGIQGENECRCTVSLFGSRYEFPDTLPMPTDDKGAMIFTFRNGRPPAIISAIPAWHPLNALKRP